MIYSPFECFQMYNALKMHFTSSSYCYVKYNGKTRVTKESYLGRNDKYFFDRLSRQKDPFGVILSNLLIDPKMWIGRIVKEEGLKNYKEYQKRMESLRESFLDELNKLEFSITQLLDSKKNFPVILTLFLENRVSIQTLVILHKIFNIFEVWKLDGDPLYDEIKSKIYKYMPLMGDINRTEYCLLCKEIFEDKLHNNQSVQ